MNEDQAAQTPLSRLTNRPQPNSIDECCPRQEEPRPIDSRREIHIKPLNHGYVVTIGCQSFAIEKQETLIQHLTKFLEDPIAIEKAWLAKEYTL